MKILLVDDADIANFIMKKLIAIVAPNATVIDFMDPRAAIDNISTLNPDLIFLDLNMPDMSGFAFLDTMKEKGLKNKVIILSSSTSEIDKKQAVKYKQVLGYYIKPLEKESLQKILSDLK